MWLRKVELWWPEAERDTEADLAPKIKRKPSEWAEQVRIMPIGGPISGSHAVKYDHKFTPHAREIMDAAYDPTVRIVVNWAGVRDAKTAICLNVMGCVITDDPCGIYDVHPIDDDVSKFSNDDVEPMIELCLDGYFVEKKSRDSGRTINYKKFKGGSLRIVNAGSLTKFRGSTVRALFMHEVDGYTDKAAIYKAINRAQGIKDAIIYMESTGTFAPTISPDGVIEYNSVIHEWHEKGDKRKWFCRCAECGGMQWLKYPQIQARDGDKRNAKYFCERCDFAHDEKQWRRMSGGGIWYPTARLSEADQREIEQSYLDAKPEQPEVRSYWRNGFNSLLPHHDAYKTKLHEFLAEGEAAKVSRDALQVWTNEIAAELWSMEGDKVTAPAWKPIFDRRLDYGLIVPKDGLFLTAFADVQKNRIEVGWRAWGRKNWSWGMDHVVLTGAVAQPDVWRELRKELARKFKHERGAELSLGMAFVDGGHFAEEVYAFFQGMARNPEPGVNGHCQASKGVGIHPHPIITHGKMHTVAKALKGRYIGTWQAKDKIYERVKMIPEAEETIDKSASREGMMFYNLRYTEEYFQGLTLETATQVHEGNQVFNTYKDKVTGNEPLDIEVGCLAAVSLHAPNFNAIEQRIAEDVEQLRNPDQPKKQEEWFAGLSAVQSGWL